MTINSSPKPAAARRGSVSKTTALPEPVQVVQKPSDIGPLVRRQRQGQALRIDDAAALCGVSVDLLSRLENGKGAVRLDKLLAVLDGLGLALAAGPKGAPWMQTLSTLTPHEAESQAAEPSTSAGEDKSR